MYQQTEETPRGNWFFGFALTLSAVLMSLTLTISNGVLADKPRDFVSILLLTLSLLSCACALFFHDAKLPSPHNVPIVRLLGKAPSEAVLCAACAVQFLALVGRYHQIYVFGLPHVAFFSLAALLAACWIAWSPIVNRRFAIMQAVSGVLVFACFVFCAWIVIRATSGDLADVMIFQRDASHALMRGENPYSLTFPNIYGDSSVYYGAQMSRNGVLQFGFPYFPLSLLWVAPWQMVLGDFRYGHLAAVAICVLCIATFRPTRIAAASALLLGFSAPAFYILQIGWTEPVVSMLFCVNIWLLLRQARGAAMSLGVFLAAKQYLVFALPLIFLLPLSAEKSRASTRDTQWKTVALAVVAAALITLPFVLWNARDFWWSVIELQFHQPFRDDSLSYPAYIKQLGGPQLSSALCFLAAIGAVVFCFKRAPRTVGGFAASVALVHFVFFAWNKQAFANYYFFVFAALCCATAAAHCEQRRDEN